MGEEARGGVLRVHAKRGEARPRVRLAMGVPRAGASRDRPAMGVFRRAAPMVGALFFVATLALVAVFDSEVRMDTRCQTASWRLRSASTKGQLRGGRRAVDAALAEMGCLPDARAAVVREIAAGRDAAAAARDGARTASPSVLVDPGARATGVTSGANAPREIARGAAEKHEENVRRSGEATRAEDERKRVESDRVADALRESASRAWEDFRALFPSGNASDFERQAYPATHAVSPFPEKTEAPDEAVGTWDACDACDACVVGVEDDVEDGVEDVVPNESFPANESFASRESESESETRGGRNESFASGDTNDEDVAHPSSPSRVGNASSSSDGSVTENRGGSARRCGKCTGCSTVLRPLRPATRFGPFQYTNEPGAMAASVFEADSARASGGAGVVKTRCFAKRYADGSAYAKGTCGEEGDETKTDFAAQEEQDLARSLAVSKLAERCGLADVSVRQWRERVRTAHPLSGEKFEGDVLFMDRAPGVSLEKLTRSPPDKPTVSGATVDPPAHLRLVRDALAAADSRKIVRAALFDFLFGQCDRHAQNVFWTVEGDFAFIDNDQALGRGWKACVANSFLIPGSEKFTIARFGNTHVNGDAPPIKDANPQVVLDYRCHAGERGEIGHAFPKAFAECTAWLDENADDVNKVREAFGFPSAADAEFIANRARSLRRRGFENALRRAQYDARKAFLDGGKDKDTHRVFAWPEPCCALTEMRERDTLVGYTCETQTSFPACDGGYAACQGAREAAFFEASAKIE